MTGNNLVSGIDFNLEILQFFYKWKFTSTIAANCQSGGKLSLANKEATLEFRSCAIVSLTGRS